MLKVLIWQVSNNRQYLDGALKTLERQHNGIELVGVTADAETSLIYESRNVSFVPLAEVANESYDVLLVGGAKWIGGMSKVTKDAARLNLPEDKLLGDWIVTIPGFTLDKYRRLQRSRLSIFASNCFGGNLYKLLGLPFRSPLINIGLYGENFIRLLNAPREYIKKTPTFREQKINPKTGEKHNFVNIGDICMSILHYEKFEEFLEQWEKRKTRINWDNLFVESYTEITYDKKFVEQFDALPHPKKVCFVPFKSDLPSAWYVNPEAYKDFNLTFGFVVLHFSNGITPFYYGPFDMLLYGKKTPLIDM